MRGQGDMKKQQLVVASQEDDAQTFLQERSSLSQPDYQDYLRDALIRNKPNIANMLLLNPNFSAYQKKLPMHVCKIFLTTDFLSEDQKLALHALVSVRELNAAVDKWKQSQQDLIPASDATLIDVEMSDKSPAIYDMQLQSKITKISQTVTPENKAAFDAQVAQFAEFKILYGKLNARIKELDEFVLAEPKKRGEAHSEKANVALTQRDTLVRFAGNLTLDADSILSTSRSLDAMFSAAPAVPTAVVSPLSDARPQSPAAVTVADVEMQTAAPKAAAQTAFNTQVNQPDDLKKNLCKKLNDLSQELQNFCKKYESNNETSRTAIVTLAYTAIYDIENILLNLNEYDLCLMCDNPGGMNFNKLYVCLKEGQLYYTCIAPNGEIIGKRPLNDSNTKNPYQLESIAAPLTLENIGQLDKNKILEITSNRKHTFKNANIGSVSENVEKFLNTTITKNNKLPTSSISTKYSSHDDSDTVKNELNAILQKYASTSSTAAPAQAVSQPPPVPVRGAGIVAFVQNHTQQTRAETDAEDAEDAAVEMKSCRNFVKPRLK